MLQTFYTITETAKLLGVHERNVKELIRIGQLETVRVGKKEKITQDSIDNLPAGYRDDPNPDQEVRKQKHPVKYDFQKRDMVQTQNQSFKQ